MNVARFNFSHGDHATHQMVLERLRKVAEAKSRNIAVLLDTKVCSFLIFQIQCGRSKSIPTYHLCVRISIKTKKIEYPHDWNVV